MNTPEKLIKSALPAILLIVFQNGNAAPLLPYWAVQTFEPGAVIDNPFFPLTDLSNTYVYRAEAEDDEGDPIILESWLTTLGPGPVILGVQTTTQRDLAYEDGLLVERTFDHYAQDTAGNVWYFGENVTIYEYDDDDNLIGTSNEGQWLAGEGDNLPGILMLAAPQPVGFNYFEEYAPGIALDNATIISVDNDVSIDFGDFNDVLKTLNQNLVDPDDREFKYYAAGIGLVLGEDGLDEMLENPEAIFELVEIHPIPVPAAAWLFGSAIGLLAWVRRRMA